MHELGIAENIMDIVRRSVPEGRAAAVGNIRLRVGPFAGIVPDSLKFCFDVLSSGSGMTNAVLQIEQTPLVALCRDCGDKSGVKNFVFACPACGGGNLEIVSGEELEIIEIEIADG
ncbi:MAG: hydrogenase maturation nickel metallochaperone HypA [Acidobacteriota bacterium]|jgi:hydrogenase nickel incorporation protein HypA/HybF|nr:hydrogenase maturation nickel metallochaperone HypA [Acidobacteriota bacterium]